jgi:ureidoglycolate lyase
MKTLLATALTREAFAPFGQVIAADEAARHYPINGGTTERYHDLANVDVSAEGGRALISIFRAQPRTLPFAVTMLERHPLGSQAFVPLTRLPYLVVVAPAEDVTAMRAFLVTGGIGVSYARGIWHHPLLALEGRCDFLVVDRGGPGRNVDETSFAEPWQLELPPAP